MGCFNAFAKTSSLSIYRVGTSAARTVNVNHKTTDRHERPQVPIDQGHRSKDRPHRVVKSQTAAAPATERKAWQQAHEPSRASVLPEPNHPTLGQTLKGRKGTEQTLHQQNDTPCDQIHIAKGTVRHAIAGQGQRNNRTLHQTTCITWRRVNDGPCDQLHMAKGALPRLRGPRPKGTQNSTPHDTTSHGQRRKTMPARASLGSSLLKLQADGGPRGIKV